MQSLLRRSQRAVVQHKVKVKKHNRLQQAVKKAEDIERLAYQTQTLREQIQDSRKRRWEEWYLGPLAPKKEYTDKEEEDLAKPLTPPNGYVQDAQGRLSRIGPKGDMKKKVRGMKQSTSAAPLRKQFSFKEGNRVVVVADKGTAKRDRGRISTILDINEKERWCIVDGLNMNPARNPSHRSHSYPTDLTTSPDGPKTLIVPHPIPTHFLRRVLTRINPDTGIQEDIIIGLTEHEKQLAGSPIDEIEDEDSEADSDSANSARANEEGPIPKEELERRAEQSARDRLSQNSTKPRIRPGIDTAAADVRETTWQPSLLSHPMPASVIDELRNKYSVFRTRHEPEYIRNLQQIDKQKQDYQKWAESGGGMLANPLKEMSLRKRKAEEKARGGTRLSVKVLEGIGEVMAKNGVRMTEEREREVRRNLALGSEVGLGRDVRGEGKRLGKAVGTLLIDGSSGAGSVEARPRA